MYRPPCFLLNSFVFHCTKSWIKQKLDRNMQQHLRWCVNLPMEMRLKENEGTHNTLSRTKSVESWTWPMWVTKSKTDSPLRSLIDMWTIKVIFVSKEIEWTMWSVALSIIQSCGKISEGTTRLDEKTECSKVIDVQRFH